jgi:hypothetical protein
MNAKEKFNQKRAEEMYWENLEMVQSLEAGEKIEQREIEKLLISNYRTFDFFRHNIKTKIKKDKTRPTPPKPHQKQKGNFKDWNKS